MYMCNRTTMLGLIFGAFSMATSQEAMAAAISVSNSLASGEILAASGNDSSSIQYSNNSNFLAVTIAIAADGSSGKTVSVSSQPSVTYNGAAMTHAASFNRPQNYSAIYYLANPAQGTNTLAVDFGANVLAAGAGAWEFGAVSLVGVDILNPVAHATAPSIPSGTTSLTLTSPTPGAISAGDFLLIATTGDNAIPNPNWTTATGSQGSFYFNGAPTGAGNREYGAQYGTVAAGDLSGTNADEIELSTTQARTGSRTFVVFNVIPEPGSLMLLAAGAAMLLGRKRRIDLSPAPKEISL